MWLLYTSETFVLVVLPVAVGLLSVLFSLPLPSLCFSLPPPFPLSLSLSPPPSLLPRERSEQTAERLLRRFSSSCPFRFGFPSNTA